MVDESLHIEIVYMKWLDDYLSRSRLDLSKLEIVVKDDLFLINSDFSKVVVILHLVHIVSNILIESDPSIFWLLELQPMVSELDELPYSEQLFLEFLLLPFLPQLVYSSYIRLHVSSLVLLTLQVLLHLLSLLYS